MTSIISGYEYDIFISYRHNDNLDGWVTDFVQNLEKELRSTLKESVTIYFDKNPHDGLLETHSVDKSLEGKLKCLIFIPIISQTYCDPKSFAWQHEFCAFNKLANEDQLGRDIKLSNGNVASRILPVKIHDLDAEDKSILESEIGGVLRSIEFIFKSAGVNRPLRSQEDHPQDNVNRTFYRDQVNKVANSVKEIITSLKSPAGQSSGPLTHHQSITITKTKRKPLIAILSLIFLVISGYFLYPKLLASSNEVEDFDKSIAVLPFADMSPGKDQEYLGDGIADDIINALSRIKELKVIGRTSSFQFKGEKIDLRDVGEKLNVSRILEGSVIKSGNRIRINAKLINVSDGTQIWSEKYEKEMDDIFAIQDQISRAISDKMKISLLGDETLGPKKKTSNTEALENVLRGNLILGPSKGDEAMPFFEKAIELDSNYADAYNGLAWSYLFKPNRDSTWLDKIALLAKKVKELDPESENPHALLYQIQLYIWDWKAANEEYEKYLAINHIPLVQHALNLADIHGDVKGGIEELNIRLTYDPIDKDVLRLIGRLYALDGKFAKGKEMINKALEIDPDLAFAYRTLAQINIQEGEYTIALENLDKGKKLDADLNTIDLRLWALTKMGKLAEAKKMYDSLGSKNLNSATNAKIKFWLGDFNGGLQYLEQALEEKQPEVVRVRTNPQFADVRENPRFKEFMKKIPFPPNNK